MSGGQSGHTAETTADKNVHAPVWEATWQSGQQARLLTGLAQKQSGLIAAVHGEAIQARFNKIGALVPALLAPDATHALNEYVEDAWQRWILFLDILRERGNSYVTREKEGFKPVLAFARQMVLR